MPLSALEGPRVIMSQAANKESPMHYSHGLLAPVPKAEPPKEVEAEGVEKRPPPVLVLLPPNSPDALVVLAPKLNPT